MMRPYPPQFKIDLKNGMKSNSDIMYHNMTSSSNLAPSFSDSRSNLGFFLVPFFFRSQSPGHFTQALLPLCWPGSHQRFARRESCDAPGRPRGWRFDSWTRRAGEKKTRLGTRGNLEHHLRAQANKEWLPNFWKNMQTGIDSTIPMGFN